jgi:hypothetical protein
VSTDQALPFQCSNRTVPPVLPAAQQSEVVTQATPPRLSSAVVDTSGVVTTDQAVPLQCSANVWLLVPLLAAPTAQQSVEVTQVTPLRTVSTMGKTWAARPAFQWLPS